MNDDDRIPSLKVHGICPICGSDHIKSGADVADKSGLRGANRIPITTTLAIPLDNYICLACGYVESYITDRSALNRIALTWPKVLPTDTSLR